MKIVSLRTKDFIPNHRLSIEIEGNGIKDYIEGTFDQHRFYEDKNNEQEFTDICWSFPIALAGEANDLKITFIIDDIAKSESYSVGSCKDIRYFFFYDESIDKVSHAPENSFLREQPVHFPAHEVSETLLHGYTNLVNYDNALMRRWLAPMAFERDFWDVIVIGSGMGGGTVADALSEKGRNVLLLEAGTMLFQSNVYNLPGEHYEWNKDYGVLTSMLVPPDSPDEPLSKLENQTNINLGGMSIFWSGQIPRMDERELQFWPKSVVNFLTNDYGYLNAERRMHKQVTLGPFQELALKFLQKQLPEYSIDDLPRSRHQPYISELGGRTALGNVLFNPTGMYSTIDQVLESTAKANKDKKLALKLNQIVRSVERSPDSSSWKVHTFDLIKNIDRTYRSQSVVLSAGCIGSAAIVLRSKLSEHKYTGKGATAHPWYEIQFGGEKSLSPRDFKNIDVTSRDHCKIILREEGQPWFLQVLINYEYWDRGVADEDVRVEVLEKKGTSVNLTLRFYIAHPIEEDNFIRLKNNTFKPEIYVKPYPVDSELRKHMRHVARRVMKAFGVHRPIEDGRETWFEKGEVPHLGGSLRMDAPANNHDGVVDENLMLKGQEGLYICDLSVFPYIPAANPSLTLVSLALRLANYINTTHFPYQNF